MWQKTYRVALPGDRVAPADLIPPWKAALRGVLARGHNTFYAPADGIAPGEVALLDLTLPGHVKLSTGVLVLYADDESFTLMTPEGHLFAGVDHVRATERDGADGRAGPGAHARLGSRSTRSG